MFPFLSPSSFLPSLWTTQLCFSLRIPLLNLPHSQSAPVAHGISVRIKAENAIELSLDWIGALASNRARHSESSVLKPSNSRYIQILFQSLRTWRVRVRGNVGTGVGGKGWAGWERQHTDTPHAGINTELKFRNGLKHRNELRSILELKPLTNSSPVTRTQFLFQDLSF
ncbi:hypothetical protein C8F04DRAFT_1299172 [Mycena alexandri]|uniref:Uncharacterized protein n=1 Tax=Mycena alexandri TaxID=1745969 RepID=A0AAD6X7A5_9AGAR|nr:hypothetical protein C8F04DRAFT_1299172 [Mycena alexandri]